MQVVANHFQDFVVHAFCKLVERIKLFNFPRLKCVEEICGISWKGPVERVAAGGDMTEQLKAVGSSDESLPLCNAMISMSRNDRLLCKSSQSQASKVFGNRHDDLEVEWGHGGSFVLGDCVSKL